MNLDLIFNSLGLSAVIAPAVLVAVLGITLLFDAPLREATIGRLTQAAVAFGLIAMLGVLLLMLLTGARSVPVEVGNWMLLPEIEFHFHLRFIFDRLSVPFVILSYVLVGTVGAFANNYLHREPGYRRFFLLYALFLLGIVVASVAGTIETLFFGWELVGLSSAMLVAFFQGRRGPVVNGQRIWTIYRFADATFLVAAVFLHHMNGDGDFLGLMGAGAWPQGQATLTPNQALFIGGLLLVAAAGKSALVPFSGWMPRAMEGPTPSSAIFYGALSVHLGTFLLLRFSPVLDLSAWLSGAVVAVGAATALYGAMCARVQTDIKSALAFASVTQVGIITVEIGLGFRYLALVHIIGHAVLRTVQLLRAPNLLHDYRVLENAVGERLTPAPAEPIVPAPFVTALYRFALERGNLDAILDSYIVRPFVGFFRWCDRVERRWTAFLSGAATHDAEPAALAHSAEESQ